MNEDSKYQWSEGMKYAAEGIKALFILNGAAAISILTFLGNSRNTSSDMIWALIVFAIGTASTIVSFSLAYLTQLGYGNNDSGLSKMAHFGSYASVGFGVSAFLLGIMLAARSLFDTLINQTYTYN